MSRVCTVRLGYEEWRKDSRKWNVCVYRHNKSGNRGDANSYPPLKHQKHEEFYCRDEDLPDQIKQRLGLLRLAEPCGVLYGVGHRIGSMVFWFETFDEEVLGDGGYEIWKQKGTDS